MLQSMSPIHRKNLFNLSNKASPPLNGEVRFWRRGFDNQAPKENQDDESGFIWSEYGTKTVKIRFRVDQWPSNNMKMLRWLREFTRAHSFFVRTLPFVVPLVFYLIMGYDWNDSTLNRHNISISMHWIRIALTATLLIAPTFVKKFDRDQVVGLLFGLSSLYLSRFVVPDEKILNIHPVLMVAAIVLLFVITSSHLEILCPHAFAGVKGRAFHPQAFDENHTEIVEDKSHWVEENSLRYSFKEPMTWSKHHHHCSKVLLSELYPNAGIPEMYSSTIEFAIYKNMSTKDLRALLQTRFWAFNMDKQSWPTWVKSSEGTFFPLEAIVLDPESFAVQYTKSAHDEGYYGSDDDLDDLDYEDEKRIWEDKSALLDLERKKLKNLKKDLYQKKGAKASKNDLAKIQALINKIQNELSDGLPGNNGVRGKKGLLSEVREGKGQYDGSDVYQLNPSELNLLAYPTIFMRTPRKVWAKWQKNLIQSIISYWKMATGNWLTATFVFVVLLEFMGAVSTYAGFQSFVTKEMLKHGEKYLNFVWRFGTDPLRHLYHYGPLFNTPIGTYGFWNGKSKLEICAAKSGPNFDVIFWNSSDDMRKKCFDDYSVWEDQFVNGFITLGVLYVLWSKFGGRK